MVAFVGKRVCTVFHFHDLCLKYLHRVYKYANLDVNQFIISERCNDLKLSAGLNLYHIELLPIFFYVFASTFVLYTLH